MVAELLVPNFGATPAAAVLVEGPAADVCRYNAYSPQLISLRALGWGLLDSGITSGLKAHAPCQCSVHAARSH